MELKSMKLEASEKSEHKAIAALDAPEYPYGLRLDLGGESLEKLGVTSLPKVGDVMTITAKVRVTGARQHEDEGTKGKVHKSMSLQITDLGIGGGDEKKKAPAHKRMYPDSNASSKGQSDSDDGMA